MNLSSEGLQKGVAARAEEDSKDVAPCWAFATFDGHAGPACAEFLKENFMVRKRNGDDFQR